MLEPSHTHLSCTHWSKQNPSLLVLHTKIDIGDQTHLAAHFTAEMGLGHYYFPFSWLTTGRHFISCPISSPDTMNLQITQTFARDVHLLFRSTPDQIMKFVTCMILRLSGELIVNLCFCHLYFQLSIANTSYIAKTTPENKNLYKIP